MRLFCVAVCAICAITISSAESLSKHLHGIQIITPVNHSYTLQLDELKRVLEVDDIKDRHVVVVSIAGAFRQGKSFLLNFFIRYLNAQYKKHDVTDWIGEHNNGSELNGFKWRAGRKVETTGIWMWSEIFTHDYPNGEKVAIILLDTQGIFDSRSSVHEYTTIFSLSMMLSSVQCYNVMQNIREDDLQHLELFTEYGRLILEQTNEKPFQYLLFLVRDWPFEFEVDYGWHGQEVIDEIFSTNDDHTPGMQRLRQRIASSYKEIGAFLMPHPGISVVRDRNFNGSVQQIDPEFIKYVKELVPALFAPENLIIKEINGEKVQAGDLVNYVQTYLNYFTSDKLPEPKTLLMATAEASTLLLKNECLQVYSNSMESVFNATTAHLNETELRVYHNSAKNKSITQFQDKAKLGGEEYASEILNKVENEIEQKFHSFEAINEVRRINYTIAAKAFYNRLIDEVKLKYEEKAMEKFAERSNSYWLDKNIVNLSAQTKADALKEFETRRMRDDEIYQGYLKTLDAYFDELRSVLDNMNNLRKFSYTLTKHKWI